MLEGSESERVLERLIEYAPPGLHLLAASRSQPMFNLPRLRVSGVLLELDVADLRFRLWEAERLFNDLTRRRCRPRSPPC